jgi:predicted CXXCH cytochrome family protein
MNYKDTAFDKSTYNRPAVQYHCGRRRFWQKSCWQGPTNKGCCGGASDCSPRLIDERWQCNRPERAGGRCCEGPNVNGDCSSKRPPCQPALSLSAWRKRTCIITFIIILTVIAASLIVNTDANDPVSMLSPRPASSTHVSALGANSCQQCHENHTKQGLEWIASAFSTHDMSSSCTQCHDYQSQPTANPHQSLFVGEQQTQTCSSCHSEHRSLIGIFKPSHTVSFNHDKHLSKHFVKNAKEPLAKQAMASCTTCHSEGGSTQELQLKPYETMCQTCHEKQLIKAPLVLASTKSKRGSKPDDIRVGKPIVRLSKVIAANTSDSNDAVKKIPYNRLKEVGIKQTVGLADPHYSLLFQGADGINVEKVIERWEAKEKYPPTELDQVAGHWVVVDTKKGKGQAIQYTPEHGDALVRNWYRYLVTVGSKDEMKFLYDVKNKELGGCAKCHSTAIEAAFDEGSTSINW